MAKLMVRNLARRPILIRGVEQFKDPNALQSKPGGYFFSSRRPLTAVPRLDRSEGKLGSSRCQELDVVLEPFESYLVETSVESEEHNLQATGMVLRITIRDVQGTQYHVDTHPTYTQKSSQAFTSLSAPSTRSYTALFHPSKPVAHLTIHTNDTTDYKTWMSTLPSNLSLSALSIPGTHNSHAHYRALPSVRCQSTDIQTQLTNGIRFLDIRLQSVHAADPTKKEIHLVHGAFPISLTGPKFLAPVLQTCYTFLTHHPSETILLSLKREGPPSTTTDAHLAHLLHEQYILPNTHKWYTDTHVPCLGAARAKIVLVRRFALDARRDSGLDATAWPARTRCALFPLPALVFCVQDWYRVCGQRGIGAKVRVVKEQLCRAAGCAYEVDRPVYLNFLSASGVWNKACWPERVAGVVNCAVEEWLCGGHCLEHGLGVEGRMGGVVERRGVRRKGKGDGGTGIVVMDFVGEGGDWDLVRLIVGMNMGVVSRFDE